MKQPEVRIFPCQNHERGGGVDAPSQGALTPSNLHDVLV